MTTKPEAVASEAYTQELADQLLAFEADIETAQDAKKSIYEAARETYGKRYAKALKKALSIKRMDADKKTEADEVDAEAFRILAIIDKPRAPRATRPHVEIIEEFDAETGEVIESLPAPQPESDLTSPSPQAGQVATIQPETVEQTVTAQEPAATSPVESEAVAISTSIQPETANEAPMAVYGDSVGGATAPLSESVDILPGGEMAVTLDGAEQPPAAPLYADPGVVVMESCPPAGIVAHPYAACWPVNNINVSEGVSEPIVKIGNLLLDGRGRYFAARAALMEYPVVQYAGNDPLADSIRWNMASRTMSGQPLRIVAHKLCKLEPERADEIMALMGLEEQRSAAE